MQNVLSKFHLGTKVQHVYHCTDIHGHLQDFNCIMWGLGITNFKQNFYRHVQSAVTPLSKVGLSVRRFFTKFKIAYQLSKNTKTAYHENPTNQ